MTITHNFRSGNSCDIHIPDRIAIGEFNEAHSEWDNWPPSEADIQEWTKEVYPNRVMPLLEQAICKAQGPGRMVEVIPGVRGWIPNNFREENKPSE